MSAVARNGLALLAATALAWFAILVLRTILFAAAMSSFAYGSGGTLWMTFLGILPELLVYAVATALLLRLLPSFRQVRWVLAFALVGVCVDVATSHWVFFGPDLADAPLGEALSVFVGRWAPIVVEVLAPLFGAGLGAWLWRAWPRKSAGTPA